MPSASQRFVLAVIFLAISSIASAQISLRTVAVTGEQAPGNPAGINFLSFQFRPSINNSGRVSFNARVPHATGGSDRSGIWSDVSGQLERIAQDGAPAPNPDTTYSGSGFTSSNISDNGQVAFCGDVYPPIIPSATTGGVLVTYSQGLGAVIAQDWNHAPDTPSNIRYGNVCSREGTLFAPPAMNGDGQVAYFSSFLNATSPGIWKTNATGTHLVARSSIPAPGAGPNASFSSLGTLAGTATSTSGIFPRLNGLGNTAFFATLAGSSITPENNRGIWYEPGGALSLAVRSGDTPPNFDPAVKFADFGDPALNNADHLAFRATLSGNGIDSTNDTSIWFKSTIGLSLVAREGSQAPGLSSGTLFGEMRSAILYDVILNANDDAAFISDITGPDVTSQNDSALWAQRSGVLGLVAREGDQAPGMPAGVLFGAAHVGDFYGQMNDPGQMVFKASLIGPGITTGNDDGYWAVLPDGATFPIIRDGDTIEVRPGDFRTISSVFQARYLTGGQDGLQRALNDFGEFTFGATFTDGSQAILVATIPEPSCGALSLFVAAAFMRKRLHPLPRQRQRRRKPRRHRQTRRSGHNRLHQRHPDPLKK